MNKKCLITAFSLVFLATSLQGQNVNTTGEKGSTGTVNNSKTETTSNSTELPDRQNNITLPDLEIPDANPKPDSVKFFSPFVTPDFLPLLDSELNTDMPFIRNYSREGMIGSWKGFHVIGSSTYEEHPFLLVARTANVGVVKNYGNLSLAVTATAGNYAGMYGSFSQAGIAANATYRISDVMSATIFGQYYSPVPGAALSLATYPYVNKSQFGGYVTFMGDRVGVDVGAERYFDPISRRWENSPIVTPKIKIGNATIGVPLGGAIKVMMDNNSRNMNPNMNLPTNEPPVGVYVPKKK